MATLSKPGPFDCLETLKQNPDMPYFLLLGKDKHAPTLIWLWAVLRELDQEDPAKISEAHECVKACIEYLHANNKKAVGLVQATFAGMFDVVRVANSKAQDPKNQSTDIEVMRAWLTRMELPSAETNDGSPDKT